MADKPETIPLGDVARMPTEGVRALLEQHQDLIGGIGSLIENVPGLAEVLGAAAEPFAEIVAPVVLKNEHDGRPAVEAWKGIVDSKGWQAAIATLAAMLAVSLVTSLRLSTVLTQRELGGGSVPKDPPNPN